jgi:peroxiredoxin
MTSWPWPAPTDDGAAAHLVSGLRLPDLNVLATNGAQVSLARLQGRAVVFCYPWTGAPGLPNPPGWDDVAGAHGSTPEAEGFRNLNAVFVGLKMAVFGLSCQSTAHQQELVLRLKLPFALLSDSNYRLQDALKLPTFNLNDTGYLRRLTLIAKDGVIERVYYPVHPPHTHAREVAAWSSASVSYTAEIAR